MTIGPQTESPSVSSWVLEDLPMAYIRTIPEDEATGLVRQLYEQDMSSDGYVGNTTKSLSLHPEIMAAWAGLSKAIRSNMDQRRYELITVAVAAELRCTY
jgi:alkylhydroperoxidase/carboxymuconolactone decarboxylase family protein YurZ